MVSKVKNFKGIPMSTYSSGIWRKIFQVLEAEAKKTPVLSTEGIKGAKWEGVKVINRVVPVIEPSPEDLYLSEEGGTMSWLRKWHHCDQLKNIYILQVILEAVLQDQTDRFLDQLACEILLESRRKRIGDDPMIL